jgi:hypothetical protein
MNCRRHGSKPTLALWMLVATADVALLLAAAGPLAAVLLVVAGLATAATVIVGGRFLARRATPRAQARRRA